jgi:hypothetical protein
MFNRYFRFDVRNTNEYHRYYHDLLAESCWISISIFRNSTHAYPCVSVKRKRVERRTVVRSRRRNSSLIAVALRSLR